MNRVSVDWKGAAGLAADVRYYGQWMRDRAWERVGHLYPNIPHRRGGEPGETVIAWLWARTVRCPNPACGVMMPLVRSFELSRIPHRRGGEPNRRAWVVPEVDIFPTGVGVNRVNRRKITFRVETGEGSAATGTVNRRGATCLACGTAVPLEYVRTEGQAKRMKAQMIAIVTEGQGGRSFYAPTPEHEKLADVPIPDDAPLTDLPEQALGFRVQLYGMTQHRDLFTPRQLTALTTFSDLVAEVRKQIERDAIAFGMSDDPTPLRSCGTGAKAYAEAVSVYLALAVDKGADYWSSLCSWNNSREIMRNVFSRQALPMVWDFAEANPFSRSTGNWINNINWIGKSLETLPLSQISGIVHQVDATELKQKNSSMISTDPPYYDNIGYADLSDFFYIWLRSSIKKIYPDIFGSMLAPKERELIAAPHRHGGDKKAAARHFEECLHQAFAGMREITRQALVNMRKITPSDYPLTVYYAFKQQEIVREGAASTGWETMLEGLIKSGFEIRGTWPIRTEMGNRMIASGTNTLASSIVLVCRPRPENAPLTSRRAFINALRQELPAALQEMQSGHIAPVDLAQASIGPGMAVYSRHSKVLEADGQPLSVRTALQLINHELDAYLAEQEGDLDSASRFALAWFEQFGFKRGSFGQADVLARAKNTSLEAMVQAGVLASGAGQVRLVSWVELDKGWEPTAACSVWEATHHLIERLHNQGEMGAAKLLAKLAPDLVAEARQLAYRLYGICERKGWSDHARDYNALVISWRAAAEETVALSQGQYQQGSLIDN